MFLLQLLPFGSVLGTLFFIFLVGYLLNQMNANERTKRRRQTNNRAEERTETAAGNGAGGGGQSAEQQQEKVGKAGLRGIKGQIDKKSDGLFVRINLLGPKTG